MLQIYYDNQRKPQQRTSDVCLDHQNRHYSILTNELLLNKLHFDVKIYIQGTYLEQEQV